MSPEQFRGQPADARSDQFSFCVALYEGLYGQRPFEGRSLQELADNVVSGRLAELRATRGVPTWVAEILGRGLQPNPAMRFPTMNELLTELDRRAGTGRKGFATGAAAKLAGVWEAPVGGHPIMTPAKTLMREAFVATGKAYASAVFAGASVVLDRYAQRWTELYVEVCEATHVRGEQSAEILDLRMSCLEEGLDDLKALCRLFRTPTAEVVENAVTAADALGTLERCQDIKLLRAVVRLPDDPRVRGEVEALRARLVDLRALSRVGKVIDGLTAVKPLVEEARRLAHAPTLAEILLLYGNLQNETSQAAANTLEEAIWIAEVARHEEVAAEAAARLVYFTGYLHARFEVGEIWARLAEVILRRMGGHDLIWGIYYDSRGSMRQEQGRLDEAIEDARLAVAAKERVLGADSADVGISLGNLSNHMAYGADFEGALEVNWRAVQILKKTSGLDHPKTAVVLANRGQFLYRLGRFSEALEPALAALAVGQRETDGQNIFVSFPMRTLGLCYMGTGRFADAETILARAVELREANRLPPLRLAEVRWPLARAVHANGGSAPRAIALALQALGEYNQAASTPLVVRDRAELELWLRTVAPNGPLTMTRRGKRTQQPSPPKPRKDPARGRIRRGRNT
jgi:tetratricopeptide (TPR) repeat protein